MGRTLLVLRLAARDIRRHLAQAVLLLVAIARALVADPRVVLADEPTGNLDSVATLDVLRLFDSLHQAGQTLVIVTHDTRIAATADRIISMRDGAFIDQTRLQGGTTGHLGALAGLED